MELFLATLLRLSVLGSALALVLAAVRRLFRGRGGQTVCYYLWLAVLLRLCVPLWVTLPLPAGLGDAPEPPAAPVIRPAPEDLENAAPVTPEDLEDAAPVMPEDLEDAAPGGGETSQSDGSANSRGQSGVPSAPDAPSFPDAPEPAGKPGGTVLTIACAVWGLGALASMSWYACGYAYCSRRIRRAAVPAGADALAVLGELDPAGRVRLMESGAVNTPLLLGLLRPVVILPLGVTEEARLRDILAHELTHARRRDLLYKWSAALITSLHWFNPLMPLVRREIGLACELSCDAAVLRTLDAPGRKRYGETLLAMAAETPSGSGPLSVTLCEEKKQLKERLVSIVRYRKAGPAAIAMAALLAAALCGCALIGGAEVSEDPQGDQPSHAAVSDGNGGASPAAGSQDVTVYELRDGLALAVPNDIADRLLVFPASDDADRGNGVDDLIRVYEKQSYEECMADYGFEDGFLFSISRYSQAAYELYLASDGSGTQGFARDGDTYYMYHYATDVQFYRSEIDVYNDDVMAPWRELEARVGDVLADFVARNGLSAHSDSEFFDREFTYDGEHVYARYINSNWTVSMSMTLSQPVRQGEGGIWCVERWHDDNYGNLYYVMPGNGVETSAEYYQRLQAEADAGQHPELLDPQQAALAWIQDHYSDVEWLKVSPDEVLLLDGDALPLTRAEIDRANEAFGSMTDVMDENGNYLYTTASEISCFFTSTYAAPEEIDLAAFLRYALFDRVMSVLTDDDVDEFHAVIAAYGLSAELNPRPSEFETPVRRYRKDDVSGLLEQYAGIAADDLTNVEGVTYLEEYDCFYDRTSDFGPGMFQCTGGEKTGDTIRLWSDSHVLTIRKTDGGYYIQSFLER